MINNNDIGLEEVALKANVHIILRSPDGQIKHESVHNTVTTAGKNGIADQILASPSLGKPTHMAVGTGSPSATDLGAELERTSMSKTRSNAIITMVATWDPAHGTGVITEAGIFDNVSGGNMWVSASFTAINKTAEDTLTITWTLTVS